MTKNTKKILMYFIANTGMYIYPQDQNNIVSFIHGFECGAKNKCDLTNTIKNLLLNKYKIGMSNDGWPGQIDRLSKKLSLSWTVTFKRITLEIIINESEDQGTEIKDILKSKIRNLIERSDNFSNPLFAENLKEMWLSLCVINSGWFKKMWMINEWKKIKNIDKKFQSNYTL